MSICELKKIGAVVPFVFTFSGLSGNQSRGPVRVYLFEAKWKRESESK